MVTISNSTRFETFGEHSGLFQKSSLFQTLGIEEISGSKKTNRSKNIDIGSSQKTLIFVIYKKFVTALGEGVGKPFNAPLSKSSFDAHLGGRICQVPAVIVATLLSNIFNPVKLNGSQEIGPEITPRDVNKLVDRIKLLKDDLSPHVKGSASDQFNFKQFDITLENWAIFLIHIIFITSCHSVKISDPVCEPEGQVVRKLSFCLDDFTYNGKFPIDKKIIEKTLGISKEWAYSFSSDVVSEMLEHSSNIPNKESLLKLFGISLKIRNRIERPFFAVTRTVFRLTNHPIELRVRTLNANDFPYRGMFIWNGDKYVRTSEIPNGPTIVIEAYGKFEESEIDNDPNSASRTSKETVIEKIIQNHGGLLEYIEAQAAAHDQLSDFAEVAKHYKLDTVPKKLSLTDLVNIPALQDVKESIDPSLLLLEKKCNNTDSAKNLPDLIIEHVYCIISSK